MRPGRAPDYQLTAQFKELPKGSFIRPIELTYVPKQVIDHLGIDARMIDEEVSVICFTRLGMMIIPREIIESI